MKMNNKDAVGVSLIYYACNIINIYLSIQFLVAGEWIYPLIFWIIYGIDKCLLIMIYKKENENPEDYNIDMVNSLISDFF